jgi:hypothetical protein
MIARMGRRPAPGAQLRHVLCVGAALAAAACGGRTELVALPQIGQLSSTAVVANDANVRMVARTDAWSGPPLANAMPVEVTVDNGSSRPLRISRMDFSLVSPQARYEALAPSELPNPDDSLPVPALAGAALRDGILESGARVTGFLYFGAIEEADAVELRMNLIDASTMTPFGTIRMSFRAD